MSRPRYPTDIITDEGWGRIHQGHGLDRASLLADHNTCHGSSDTDIQVEEVHLTYQPRVMWCERYGDPCDSNGEWHGHWHAVSANDRPDTKFTLVHAPRTRGAR